MYIHINDILHATALFTLPNTLPNNDLISDFDTFRFHVLIPHHDTLPLYVLFISIGTLQSGALLEIHDTLLSNDLISDFDTFRFHVLIPHHDTLQLSVINRYTRYTVPHNDTFSKGALLGYVDTL